MGAQASEDQLQKILNYIEIGKEEGATCVTGGERAHLGGELENGYYVKPTVFVGHNKMRIFQEEIFGPVLSVTKFKTLEDAIAIGNDTVYGLGAGVWSRNGTAAYRVGRALQAGRVWTQLLPFISRSCRVWWLQTIWFWPGNAQNDSRALSTNQEFAGELQPKAIGIVLSFDLLQSS